MKKTGIFYGSSSGNTEDAAKKIQSKIEGAEIKNISSAEVAEFSQYELILLGASTWGYGDLQDDWEGKIGALSGLDLNGKCVGFFGTGDASSYPDTFVDSIGILAEALKGSDATVVGKVSTDGYEFSESKAVVDGMFLGLPLDDDNEPGKTDQRIDEWVKAVQSECE